MYDIYNNTFNYAFSSYLTYKIISLNNKIHNYFLINVDVWVSLRVPRLIPRTLKLTTMYTKGNINHNTKSLEVIKMNFAPKFFLSVLLFYYFNLSIKYYSIRIT